MCVTDGYSIDSVLREGSQLFRCLRFAEGFPVVKDLQGWFIRNI